MPWSLRLVSTDEAGSKTTGSVVGYQGDTLTMDPPILLVVETWDPRPFVCYERRRVRETGLSRLISDYDVRAVGSALSLLDNERRVIDMVKGR